MINAINATSLLVLKKIITSSIIILTHDQNTIKIHSKFKLTKFIITQWRKRHKRKLKCISLHKHKQRVGLRALFPQISFHCHMAKSCHALHVSFITHAWTKGDNIILRECVCVCVCVYESHSKWKRERERNWEFIGVQAPVSVNISNYLTVTSGG